MRRIEVFRRSGGWKWRLFADNGRVLAESVPNYRNRADCHSAVGLVLSLDSSTRVLDHDVDRPELELAVVSKHT